MLSDYGLTPSTSRRWTGPVDRYVCGDLLCRADHQPRKRDQAGAQQGGDGAGVRRQYDLRRRASSRSSWAGAPASWRRRASALGRRAAAAMPRPRFPRRGFRGRRPAAAGANASRRGSPLSPASRPSATGGNRHTRPGQLPAPRQTPRTSAPIDSRARSIFSACAATIRKVFAPHPGMLPTLQALPHQNAPDALASRSWPGATVIRNVTQYPALTQRPQQPVRVDAEMLALQPLEQLPRGSPGLGLEPLEDLRRHRRERVGASAPPLRLLLRPAGRAHFTRVPRRAQPGEELLQRRRGRRRRHARHVPAGRRNRRRGTRSGTPANPAPRPQVGGFTSGLPVVRLPRCRSFASGGHRI